MKILALVLPAIAGGVYVNELEEGEGNDRVRQAHGANYNRLAHIKAKYDPANLFRLNANTSRRDREGPILFLRVCPVEETNVQKTRSDPGRNAVA